MKTITINSHPNYAVNLACHRALKIIALLQKAVANGNIIDESKIDTVEFTEKLDKLALVFKKRDGTSVEALQVFMADILGLYAVDFILPGTPEEFQRDLLQHVQLCMEAQCVGKDNVMTH